MGSSEEDCIIVLVGVTADATKRGTVRRILQDKSECEVCVPDLPQRRGLIACSDELLTYLDQERIFDRFRLSHFLNYISGGYIFRLAASHMPDTHIGRVVYARGPIQECVPRALVKRYSWVLVRLFQGRMITDLASDRLMDIPHVNIGLEQGLIVETGVSKLAASLGLHAGSIPEESWLPEAMLPGATDVLRVAESHDDVYGSESFLGAALQFFETGRFSLGKTAA